MCRDCLDLRKIARQAMLVSFVMVWQSIAPAEESESLARVTEYDVARLADGGSERRLALVPRSLLNWSNPVFGTTDGGLYLWTDDGAPAALLKTYKTRNGRWFEQVRSFCVDRIVARESKDGAVFWSPDRGAPAMQPLANTPAPASTDVARLVQMKSLHRQFSAKGELEGAGGEQTLRLYPTPLYRYSNDRVIDGALFGFAQGTAPDVILHLEARNTGEDGDDRAGWFYQVGSIGIFKVDVYRGGTMVWSAPRRTAAQTRPNELYDGRRLP